MPVALVIISNGGNDDEDVMIVHLPVSLIIISNDDDDDVDVSDSSRASGFDDHYDSD